MAHVLGFYARWVVANGLAEAAGLGTTFVLGMAAAPVLMRASGAVEIVGGALLAVLLGTLLEGVVVGAAQARVLVRHSQVPARAWIVATSVGAGAAWMLGMVPSTVMAFLADGAPAGDAASGEPGPLVTCALAAGLGLVTGPVLGAAQWAVLRRSVPRATSWLWANAAAWAVGMPVIFLGMDIVPWEGPAVAQALAIYAVTFVTGLVVGAVHGRVLARLLADAGAAATPAGA